MNYYYGEKLVSITRTFRFASKMKSEIKFFDGTTMVVDRSEITEQPVFENNVEEVQEDFKFNDFKNDEQEDKAKTTLEEFQNAFPKSESQVVVAHKVSNSKETEIGEIGSDEFNKFVDSKKLSVEAIQSVLDGTQKTHKGFSFHIKP